MNMSFLSSHQKSVLKDVKEIMENIDYFVLHREITVGIENELKYTFLREVNHKKMILAK